MLYLPNCTITLLQCKYACIVVNIVVHSLLCCSAYTDQCCCCCCSANVSVLCSVSTLCLFFYTNITTIIYIFFFFLTFTHSLVNTFPIPSSSSSYCFLHSSIILHLILDTYQTTVSVSDFIFTVTHQNSRQIPCVKTYFSINVFIFILNVKRGTL